MPVLEIQGTDAPLVPYGDWANMNDCSTIPHTGTPPDFVADGTHLRTDPYGPRTGAPVMLYTVGGGGHTWPGGEQ